LLERSLIDTVAVSPLARGDDDDAMSKILFVPRTVRDYVRETMEEVTAKSIDRTALELFFGTDWQTGEIASSPSGRRTRSPLCDGYEIQNGSTLILRFVRRALAERNGHDAQAGIRLASAFIESLMLGDHFRSAVSLCRDVIATIEEFGGYEKELNILRFELARSLRMVSRVGEARDVFEQLDHDGLTKSQQQSAELGLALSYEKLADTERAALAAKRAIALDKKSSLALQAQGILAEQIEELGPRVSELQRLLSRARREEHHVLVANFLLTLASDVNRDAASDSPQLLKEILDRGSKSDNYNRARAIVEFAKNIGRPLTERERDRLIEAYHYFYHERLYSLFDKCHAVLWDIFEAAGDSTNLLNLFRHSSFIWRLNGRDELEIRYLTRLVRKVQDLLLKDVRRATRDGAYFVVRVSVVLGDWKTEDGSLKLPAAGTSVSA
jgi:tetratricopeptide (TPR) repeat protein